MTPQRLSEGPTRTETLKARYQPSGTKGRVIKPADQAYVIWFGKSGHGKSYFFQSNPGAFIINFDGSPTTTPNPQAEIWPEPGVMFTWPQVTEKITGIINAKKNGLPGTPTGIFFDTLAGALKMARVHAAHHLMSKKAGRSDNAQAKTIEEMTPFDVRFQEGKTVWDLTYDSISNEAARCTYAGIGFGIAIHLDKEILELADEKGNIVPKSYLVPIATAKCMRRLYPFADASLYIKLDHTQVYEGKGAARKMVPAVKQGIISQFQPLADYLKARTERPLPTRIDVTESGWSGFVKAYNLCIGEPA